MAASSTPLPQEISGADPDHKRVVKLDAARRRLIQAFAPDAENLCGPA